MSRPDPLSCLAALLRSQGTPAFAAELLAFVDAAVCPVDQLAAYWRGPAASGAVLGTAGCLPARRARLLTQRYVDAYHALDVATVLGDGSDGEAWLSRLHPDMPASAAYKDFFFRHGGLADRVAIATRDGERVLACHWYRAAGSEPFSEADLAALLAWLPTLASALRQHQALSSPATASGAAAVADARTDALSTLSPREHEVCRRLLSGLSTEAIALDLGISPNTVRTFRKKLYRKLEVSSRFDLCHRYRYPVGPAGMTTTTRRPTP